MISSITSPAPKPYYHFCPTSTVATLVNQLSSDLIVNTWVIRSDSFIENLTKHVTQFRKEGVQTDKHFGFIEKFDLDPADNTQIFVSGDIFGDVKSLIIDLQSLKDEGLLDGSYKCKRGIHLVFLGNYTGIYEYSMATLVLLMRLREENPNQVHLLRGKTEEVDHLFACGARLPDVIFTSTIRENEDTAEALRNFYDTMPLTLYISIKSEGVREYSEFRSALFEPTIDPVPLLDQESSYSYIPISKGREFSDRVKKLSKIKLLFIKAQQRIHFLGQKVNEISQIPELSAAGTKTLELFESVEKIDEAIKEVDEALREVSKEYRLSAGAGRIIEKERVRIIEIAGDLNRSSKIEEYSPDLLFIRDYLTLCSERHKVGMLFCMGSLQQREFEDNFVTIIPARLGPRRPDYRNRNEDTLYLFKMDATLAKSKSRIIRRTWSREVHESGLQNQHK